MTTSSTSMPRTREHVMHVMRMHMHACVQCNDMHVYARICTMIDIYIDDILISFDVALTYALFYIFTTVDTSLSMLFDFIRNN